MKSAKFDQLNTKDSERERERETKVGKRNSKTLTLNEIKNFIEEKCRLKVINEDNKNFLLKILNYCPDEAINIYTWATLSNATGLMFKPSFTYVSNHQINYLVKDSQLSFNQGGLNHKLIIGDNYFALLNLLITYRNKVDIIYIDPPYGCNGMNQCAGVNYRNNYSRDDLLSMLKPRLELARELLTNDGVMFCSIDDRNHAYVKLLFDEVFGENKFVNTIIWQRHSGGGQSDRIITGHDYILTYRMNNKTKFYAKKNLEPSKIKLIDGMPYYFDANPLKKPNATGGSRIQPGLERYLVYEELSKEEQQKYQTPYYVIKEYAHTGKNIIYPYRRADIKKLYSITGCDSSAGIDELISLGFKQDDFSFPKPVELMKKIIFANFNPNALVVDFFAGSGTTGQAVLELNQEDGGKRQFILCVNAEDKSNEICRERLYRVMTGKTSDGTSNFPWIRDKRKNHPLGDSLEVDNINHCADNDPDVFKKIDLDCYFSSSAPDRPDTPQAKRDWICQEFQITCHEKQMNENK